MEASEIHRAQHRARGRAQAALRRRFPDRFAELVRQQWEAGEEAGAVPPVSDRAERKKARERLRARLRARALRGLARARPRDFAELYAKELAEEGLSLPLPRAGVAACGTVSGYQRHLQLGEDACPDCLTANNEVCGRWHREVRAPQEKAVTVLAKRHRPRFREVLAKERAGLRLDELPAPERSRVWIRTWRAARKQLVAELPEEYERLVSGEQQRGGPR